MDREQCERWCENGILALVLAILVFGPLATGAVRPLEFLVLQALTLGVAALWLLRIWVGKEVRFLWPPVSWAVVAFVVYAVVRYRQADIEYVAREELIRVLVYAFLFFAVLNNVQRQDSIQLLVCVMVFLAMGIAMYAGYQFITGSNMVWHFVRPEQYDKRGSGTYICPNHLAGLLEMVLPLGLAYTLSGRLSHVLRIVLGYASLVVLAGIGVSISRGGILATGLALIVFFVLLIRQRDYRIPGLIALGVLLVAGLVFVSRAKLSQQRFGEMFVAGKVENIRFRLWEPAIRIWREDPWLGAGPAHFDFRFRVYRPEDVQMRPNRVHNDYLNTLTDWGAVGFAIVAAGWGLLGWGAVRSWKYAQRANDLAAKRSNRGAFMLGGTIGLLALGLHSFVDFNLHIPANAILATCLAALLAGHIRFATERFWLRAGLAWRGALTLALVVGGVYLGHQWAVRWREFTQLEEARVAEETTKRLSTELGRLDRFSEEYTAKREAIAKAEERFAAALRQAHAVSPTNFETTYRLGEAIRVRSWQGNADYRDLAREAMEWFQRGMTLNPFDGYNYLRYAMCLHWIGQPDEAKPYFDRALALDPNGYYTVAHIGWYHVQHGDYVEAKRWFERSLRLKPHLKPDDNPIAYNYLNIVNRRLAEGTARI